MDTSLVPTLESDTLLLRPWFQEFAEDFIRINLQPGTITNPCTNPGMTLNEAKVRLKAIEKNKRIEWSIALKTEDIPVIVGGIGICEVISIKEYKNVKEIGYGVDPNYWGRGIMPRAIKIVEQYCFESLGSEAVIIRIVKGNMKSERVAEKCGYQYYNKTKIGSEYKVSYIKRRSGI